MLFNLGAALLDACVLSILGEGDAYGYVLTQRAKEVVDISESTLYPVLRRLQKDGLLETYDKPISGRLRRYYTITEKGREMLGAYRAEWESYKQKVEHLLIGGDQL